MGKKNSSGRVRKRTKQKQTVFLRIAKIWGTLLVIAIIVGGYLGIRKIGIPLFRMYREAKAVVEQSDDSTFRGELTSIIYDTDNNEIKKLKGDKDVYYLSYKDIPDAAKLAFIAVEDKHFASHRGIDLVGITRSVIALALHRGEKSMGGSTITQQLARNIFLGFEKTYTRKIREIFIAGELEKKYTKEKILEYYINNVYFANGFYGLEAAAEGYFGKKSSELTISQLAFLAAIPNSPAHYDPYTNKENTLARRNRILNRMYEEGYITGDQLLLSSGEEPELFVKRENETNDYVQTYIIHCATRSLMEHQGFEFRSTFENNKDREQYKEQYSELYDTCKQSLYTNGYRIYTSIDTKMQEKLQNAVATKLKEEGFMDKTDDGIYKLQGAAVCIDNETGRVAAVVGGREADQETFGLNRAYQSFRQPGSAIKPVLVYGPALGKGYTPDSILDDNPLPKKEVRNTGGSYSGRITLRQAVAKSSNVATFRLYREMKAKNCMRYLEKMNFEGLREADYKYDTTCLGGFTKGVTPIEMAAAYAALENDGKYRVPDCIVRITDSQDVVISSGAEDSKRVYNKNAARMMTDVLTTVVESGTATDCKLTDMPAACKTGTTTDNVDGWLCGYTPYYTTVVWIGKDKWEAQEGLKGSSYPAAIWKSFMEDIHRTLPRKEFEKADQPKTSKDYDESATTEEETTPPVDLDLDEKPDIGLPEDDNQENADEPKDKNGEQEEDKNKNNLKDFLDDITGEDGDSKEDGNGNEKPADQPGQQDTPDTPNQNQNQDEDLVIID